MRQVDKWCRDLKLWSHNCRAVLHTAPPHPPSRQFNGSTQPQSNQTGGQARGIIILIKASGNVKKAVNCTAYSQRFFTQERKATERHMSLGAIYRDKHHFNLLLWSKSCADCPRLTRELTSLYFVEDSCVTQKAVCYTDTPVK